MQVLQQQNLPRGWTITELQDCVDILDGQRVPINSREREKRSGKIPYYGATGQIGWIDDYLFDEELLLLGEDGAPFFDPSKNKAYVIRGKSWVNNHAHVLRARTFITSNSYLCYYLNIFHYDGYVSGTTRPKLNQAPMKKIPIPLAPLNEQKRIVSKIEELFTKLDAGIEYLKKARTELKRYRQSVLDAAFRGKLSEHWRMEQNQDGQYQTQDELACDNAALTELDYLNSISRILLPTTWKFVNLGRLTMQINPGFPSGKHNQSGLGVPHIRPMNINEKGQIDLALVKYVQDESYDNLRKGDVLFNNTNSPELLGKTTYFKQDTNWAYSNHMTRIRLDTSSVNPAWIAYALHDLFLKGFFKKSCVHHVNQASINSTFLAKNTFVPLPPLDEQNVIVEEIERSFSIVEEIEPSLRDTELLGHRLRQSILRQAFSGKLVPQDPNDEPAEKLLEQVAKQNRNVESLSTFPTQLHQ